LSDFGDADVLCKFSNKPAAAEDGIVRSSQLSSLLLGQAAVQNVMAGSTANPS